MEFRLGRKRLRGSDSARLRGTTAPAAATGTIHTGHAVAGAVETPQPSTTALPGPRTGFAMAGAKVQPRTRAAILKRGLTTVSRGASVPVTTVGPSAGKRTATGRVAVPPTVVAPAIQTKDDVTGSTPRVSTPVATVTPRVPRKATGTPRVPGRGTIQGRSR